MPDLTPVCRRKIACVRCSRHGRRACRIWYDNLYLRVVFHNAPAPQRSQHHVVLASVPRLRGISAGLGARYYTRVTFQGDGLGSSIAAWPSEATYVESAAPPHAHV